jgi:ADP-heptose:LPS heptosyltransferase
LLDFSSVLQMPNCRFVDLQYGDTRAEREAVANNLGVHVEQLGDVDNSHDIDGLAALMAACDIVVSVSNTTAHLAGALGRPIWVFAPHGDARPWYWFEEGNESPWYPYLRVKRQEAGQSWADLIASSACEIW